MPTASLATDQPLARVSSAASTRLSDRMALDWRLIRCGLAVTSTISSAPCTAGRIHVGRTRTSLSGTATWSAAATATVTATGQRSSPSVLRRHAGNAERCVHLPGGLVQPLARVHALRLQAQRDQALEFVDPGVQRPDPVHDLGRRDHH